MSAFDRNRWTDANHYFSWLTKRTNERIPSDLMEWFRLIENGKKKSYFDRLYTWQMIAFQFVQSHAIDRLSNESYLHLLNIYMFIGRFTFSLPCIASFVYGCPTLISTHNSHECQRNSVLFSVNPTYWFNFEFLEPHHHRLERLFASTEKKV